MPKNQTLPKPADAEQESGKELDETACSPSSIPAEIWRRMDKFDRDWILSAQGVEDMSPHRKSIYEAVYDHESCGNWDVSFALRAIISPENQRMKKVDTTQIAVERLFEF